MKRQVTRGRHNHDVFREITPETAVAFAYADITDDLWVKRPDGYWICLGDGSGQDPLLEEQWHIDLSGHGYDRRMKKVIEEVWGPLTENFAVIQEEP